MKVDRIHPLRTLIMATFLLGLLACDNPIRVDITLTPPCDQPQALSAVGTYRVTVDSLTDTQEQSYSSGETAKAVFAQLPFEEALTVTVEAWEGPNSDATMAAPPKAIGRTLPLNVTEESGQDALKINLITGQLNTFGTVTDSEGKCQSMSQTLGRHGHSASYVPELNKVLLLGGAVMDVATGAEQFLDDVELFDPASGTFEQLPAMPIPRAYHTATVLEDGRVFVAGGFVVVDNRLQAQGSWLLVDLTKSEDKMYTYGSLKQARAHHTATLLDTGLVVVLAGGCAGDGCTTTSVAPSDNFDPVDLAVSVEYFDVTNETSTEAQELQMDRAMHGASALAGQKVIFTGGIGIQGQAVCEIELYAHGTGQPTSTVATLSECPHQHVQVAINTTRVALIGGRANPQVGNASALSKVQFWNTTQGVETNNSLVSLTTARAGHAAYVLTDGSILVVGGVSDANGTVAERLVPLADGSGDFEVAPVSLPPAQSRELMGTTLLPNNQILITGGRTTQGTQQTVATAEMFFGN